MKRLIKALILFTLVFVLGLSACTPASKEPKDDTSDYIDVYDENTYKDMEKLTITQNNVSSYYLLLPSNASDILYYAAEEFNYFLQECTGLSLAVVTEGQAVPTGLTNCISIGETAKFSSQSITFDYSQLNTDGFFVKVIGGNVYVNGANDRGRLYGCYEILKRYLGVRFLTVDCTHMPKRDSFKIPVFDFQCAPEFVQRFYLSWDSIRDTRFVTRTTQYSDLSSGTIYGTNWATELGNIHTSLNYVPQSIYLDNKKHPESYHPEFYASYTNPVTKNTYDDLCYTNGITADGKLDETMSVSVAKVVINTITDYLTEHPEKEFFMLGIMDNYNSYCLCDTCKEREALFGTKSGYTNVFMNVVAKEVNSWAKANGINHEVNLIQFAYYWTLKPPVYKAEDGSWQPNSPLVVLSDNVYVRYAPLNADYAYYLGDERQMKSYRDVVEGWSAIAKNMMMYDYCERFDFNLLYMPHLSYISNQAKYLKENNFYYWFYESIYYTDGVWNADLIRYITQNLWWDVNANVAKLANEFIEIYNGQAAAPYIKAYVRIMEENYAKLRRTGDNPIYVFGTSEITAANYPVQMMESCTALLQQAENAINNDQTLSAYQKEVFNKRLIEVKLMPESIILLNYDSYYLEGKDEFTANFHSNAKSVGCNYYTPPDIYR